ncbi:MAG: hypothetical protein BM485_11255 [Desulfobulbaceae bacterium DB1]|nr:MAG: hypothetical protein BM485_11255 [Desulfobulbaceae bacterium DB1]
MSRRALIFNSISGSVLFIVNIVVAFYMSPILVKVLGNRDFGLWELVISVVGYMGILDLGIGPALVRFVSVADGKKDLQDLQQTMSTAFIFFVIIGIITSLLFLVFSIFPHLIIGDESKKITHIGSVFFLFGLNALVLFPMRVFIAGLMGVQRHYFINNSRAIITVIRSVVIIILLHLYPNYGLIWLVLMESISNTIQCFLFVVAAKKDKRLPPITISSVSLKKAKELFDFGAKSVVIMVALRLQNQSVPLIIANVIGLSHIVFFVMPNRLIEYGKELSTALGLPLTPYLGTSLGAGNNFEVEKKWLQTTMSLQIVSMAMPLFILFCGENFLSLWIGPDYAIAGRWPLYILLAGLVADSLATNAVRILTVKAKHGKNAIIWFSLSVLSIPLGIWGARQWSIAGVALGTTTVAVFGNLISLYMACSVMKVPLLRYFSSTLKPLFFPLLFLGLSLWISGIFIMPKNYLMLFLQCTVSGIIYLTTLWIFTLGNDIKNNLCKRFIRS